MPSVLGRSTLQPNAHNVCKFLEFLERELVFEKVWEVQGFQNQASSPTRESPSMPSLAQMCIGVSPSESGKSKSAPEWRRSSATLVWCLMMVMMAMAMMTVKTTIIMIMMTPSEGEVEAG